MDRFDLLESFGRNGAFKYLTRNISEKIVYEILNDSFYSNVYIFRESENEFRCLYIIPLSDIEDKEALDYFVKDYIENTKGHSCTEILKSIDIKNFLDVAGNWNAIL